MSKNSILMPTKQAWIPVPENEAIINSLPEKYMTVIFNGRTKRIYKKVSVPIF